jgi:hypothetical protein
MDMMTPPLVGDLTMEVVPEWLRGMQGYPVAM